MSPKLKLQQFFGCFASTNEIFSHQNLKKKKNCCKNPSFKTKVSNPQPTTKKWQTQRKAEILISSGMATPGSKRCKSQSKMSATNSKFGFPKAFFGGDFSPTHLKNICKSNWTPFPQVGRGANKKYLSCHHLVFVGGIRLGRN